MNANENGTFGNSNESHKVVSLQAYRHVRQAEEEDQAYQTMIAHMDKLELLEEMVRFQEQRSKLGNLDLPMIVRGRHLFRALEKHAETQELKILTRSYRRHLDFELREYQKAQAAQSLI